MKRKTLYGFILLVASMSVLSGCSGELARRADGTCVLMCGG
ncbi:MAG: hypothetical protein VX185_06225 [Pseudomonadota bacterium]|nr:hypothetical protein [Pseudomonadota bacterium]|tara:strand:+ start:346 stop:468 length:123 start_codon:yes stop_codon:yes gene_type:complete